MFKLHWKVFVNTVEVISSTIMRPAFPGPRQLHNVKRLQPTAAPPNPKPDEEEPDEEQNAKEDPEYDPNKALDADSDTDIEIDQEEDKDKRRRWVTKVGKMTDKVLAICRMLRTYCYLFKIREVPGYDRRSPEAARRYSLRTSRWGKYERPKTIFNRCIRLYTREHPPSHAEDRGCRPQWP